MSMTISTIIARCSKPNTKIELSASVRVINSPIGDLLAVADEKYLYLASFVDSIIHVGKRLGELHNSLSCDFVENGKSAILDQFEKELSEYFDGSRLKFTVPLRTVGTQFQKEAWDKLQEIPYGSTQTYSGIAKAMGRPVAHARAVGSACKENGHVIVIPCHRIVAVGSQGGFSAGLDRKEWLLKHEKQYCP